MESGRRRRTFHATRIRLRGGASGKGLRRDGNRLLTATTAVTADNSAATTIATDNETIRTNTITTIGGGNTEAPAADTSRLHNTNYADLDRASRGSMGSEKDGKQNEAETGVNTRHGEGRHDGLEPTGQEEEIATLAWGEG